jgi:2-C-methyl-D-erythritol 4-phosphate cytidylyltransferase
VNDENRVVVNDETRNGAVIVAAGASRRFGQDKLFVPLLGKPLLTYTLAAIQACDEVHEIVLVMSDANLEQGKRLAANYDKISHVCLGGARRRDSVLTGLSSLTGCKMALVHDGARPLVTTDIITTGLAACRQWNACVPGVPVKDTIKTVDAQGVVVDTPDRSALRAIQTPQIFDYSLLMKAYEMAGETDFTDDGAVVEAMGHAVYVYPGAYDNLKVTTAEDVELAEAILKKRGFSPR